MTGGLFDSFASTQYWNVRSEAASGDGEGWVTMDYIASAEDDDVYVEVINLNRTQKNDDGKISKSQVGQEVLFEIDGPGTAKTDDIAVNVYEITNKEIQLDRRVVTANR